MVRALQPVRFSLSCILALLVLLAPAPAALAASANRGGGEVRRALENAEASHDLQRSLPGIDAPAETPEQQQKDKPDSLLDPPPWLLKLLGDVGIVVFWVVIAATALALIWAVVRELPFVAELLPRRKPGKPAAPEYRVRVQPSAEEAHTLLEDADRLAALGDFAGAVRLLLHRTLEDVAERLGQYLPAAWTSREVLDRSPLPPDGRHAFDEIVRAVETSHFGGRSFGADDYARCRRSYERFAGIAA
ncbi:MAG: DUF4129 domain-containing protein [Alphaproteobacteria bacterium]|nr:DUF4129 domain-containing protein [Alphaproteobacteria bacterium]